MFARDTSWNRLNRLAYILQVIAVGALAAAWLAIGLGLFSGPGADLEAGGRFAANFTVYWPFLFVISPVLVVRFPRIVGGRGNQVPAGTG
ncbi:hypothetical protein ACW9HJ_34750 [Nocardia gipuzkoensis]